MMRNLKKDLKLRIERINPIQRILRVDEMERKARETLAHCSFTFSFPSVINPFSFLSSSLSLFLLAVHLKETRGSTWENFYSFLLYTFSFPHLSVYEKSLASFHISVGSHHGKKATEDISIFKSRRIMEKGAGFLFILLQITWKIKPAHFQLKFEPLNNGRDINIGIQKKIWIQVCGAALLLGLEFIVSIWITP